MRQLHITDINILRLPAILGVPGQHVWDQIGIHKQSVNNIKNGKQSFANAHILAAIKSYKLNANWIFGIEKEVFRGLHLGFAQSKKAG